MCTLQTLAIEHICFEAQSIVSAGVGGEIAWNESAVVTSGCDKELRKKLRLRSSYGIEYWKISAELDSGTGRGTRLGGITLMESSSSGLSVMARRRFRMSRSAE